MRDIDDGDLQPLCTNDGQLPISQMSAEIAERTAFIVNNLSVHNIQQNVSLFRVYFDQYGDSYRQWLAEYYIDRVAKESNFHSLYFESVLATEDETFIEMVKKETFKSIKQLLQSAKRAAVTADNRVERDALKNLGKWLGLMTIGRDKPILAEELDLKALIMEASQRSERDLVYILPFVTKVLLAVNQSEVFTARCAWIMALLKVLAGLHQQDELKLSLQFDIEALFRDLRIDLAVFQESGEIVQPEFDTISLSEMEMDFGGTQEFHLPEQFSISHEVNVMPTRVNSSELAMHTVEGLMKKVSIPVEQLKSLRIEPHLFYSLCQEVVASATGIIHEIIERTVLVAVATTETICRKDFALDADDHRLRDAAQHMARALTASLAGVSCRAPLEARIPRIMQERMGAMLRSRHFAMNPCVPMIVDKIATDVSENILQVTSDFILRKAAVRAALDVEHRMKQELALRRNCKLQNIAFDSDILVHTEQAALPEPLRLSGDTPPSRMAIYEKFSQYTTQCVVAEPSENTATAQYSDISLPTHSSSSIETTSSQSSGLSTLCQKFTIVVHDVERVLEQGTASAPLTSRCKPYQAIWGINERLRFLVANPSLSLLDQVVYDSTEKFLHGYENPNATQSANPNSNLTGIDTGRQRQIITKQLIASADEQRFNILAVDVLIRSELLSFREYDFWLATEIQQGNLRASEFFRKLSVMYIQHPSEPLPATMFPISSSLIGTHHQRYTHLGPAPVTGNPTKQQLVGSGRLTNSVGRGPASADPRDAAHQFLKYWTSLCHEPMEESQRRQLQILSYSSVKSAAGITTEEGACNLLKFCIELCTKATKELLEVKADDQHAIRCRLRCFNMIDAIVKLMRLVVAKDPQSGQCLHVNLPMLEKVLAAITDLMLCQHEALKQDFNPMPFHRILITFFKELTSDSESMSAEDRCTILHHYGQALYAVQPRRAPGFAFHWFDIIGHHDFIARHLSIVDGCPNPAKASAIYAQLVFCHIRFMAPFLQSPPLSDVINLLYKGMLRVLLVVLHDFPEFFCRYHYVLCDCIPPNCIQLRNLVLSAAPPRQRLPDPFALSFPEIEECVAELLVEPENHAKIASIFPPGELKDQLDCYLRTRTSVSFLASLPQFLFAKTPRSTALPPTITYNMTAINAVVLYVGASAMDALKTSAQNISLSVVGTVPAFDIYLYLLESLNSEGRYMLLNAICNQLRYPSTHTYFFACVTLLLFRRATFDAAREQIARVLFERVVALRPHPWGVLWIFIELLRNPAYKFWSYEFAHCAPEIEKMLASVQSTAQPYHDDLESPVF